MNIIDVNTLKLSDNFTQYDLIQNIRQDFGLNEPPFDTISDQFLLLAFMPDCIRDPQLVDPATVDEILETYGICDNTSLVLYGYNIFRTLVAIILYETITLRSTPGILTRLNKDLTRVNVLSSIMINKKINACHYLREEDFEFLITQSTECADPFVALLAVIFFNLQEQEYPNYLTILKEWFLKNTIFPFLFKSYLDQHNIPAIVYTIIDLETLIPQIQEYKRRISGLLAEAKISLSPDQYLRFLTLYAHKLTITVNDAYTRPIIVNSTDSLQQIYSYLGWFYTLPSYDPIVNLYYVTLSLPEKTNIIGIAKTSELAESDARDYLITLGYITLNKNIRV